MATLIPSIKVSSGTQQLPSIRIGNSGIYATGSGMSIVVDNSVSLTIDSQGIKIPTGSSNNPSLSFVSSTNSGMFLSSSGPSIALGGSQVAVFTSGGMILPTGSLTITNPIVSYRAMSSPATYGQVAEIQWAGPNAINTPFISFTPTSLFPSSSTGLYFTPSQTGYYSINANINIGTTTSNATVPYQASLLQIQSPSAPTVTLATLSLVSIAPLIGSTITISINEVVLLRGGSWYVVKAGRSQNGTFSFTNSYLRIIKLF